LKIVIPCSGTEPEGPAPAQWQEGEENTYAIRVTNETHLYSYKENPITLKSAHPDLPLPNPVYLRIHAACYKIAHFSGPSEYMDRISEDVEDIGVLYDGLSTHVLSFALQPYRQEAVVL